jgi:hypothetical protein
MAARGALSDGRILSGRDREKGSGRKIDSVRAPSRATAARAIVASSGGRTLSDRDREKEKSGRKIDSVRAPSRATAAPGIVAPSLGRTLRDRWRRKESGRKTDLPPVPIRLTTARGILVSSGGKIARGLAADHRSSAHGQILRNPPQGHPLALHAPMDRAESSVAADDLNLVVDPIRGNGLRAPHGPLVVRIATQVVSHEAEEAVRVALQEDKNAVVRLRKVGSGWRQP